MKYIYLSILPTLCCIGCFSYSITTQSANDSAKLTSYCQDAEFVASDFIDVSTAPPSEMVGAQKLLLKAAALKQAKTKYGEDVTIVNLQYDILKYNAKKKNLAVTFDVLRCP